MKCLNLNWKFLIPVSFINLVAVAIADRVMLEFDLAHWMYVGVMFGLNIFILLVSLFLAGKARPEVERETFPATGLLLFRLARKVNKRLKDNSMVPVLVFAAVSLVTLGAAIAVVTNKNILHSAYYLMLAFVGVASCLCPAGSPLYCSGPGADLYRRHRHPDHLCDHVDPQVDEQGYGTAQPPVDLVCPGSPGSFWVLGWIVYSANWPVIEGAVPDEPISLMGQELLTTYVVPFEIASVLLLAALVGAILIGREKIRVKECRMSIPLNWFLVLAAALFSIGLYGVLSRRNAIGILMGIELMLNAVNINLVAFWRYLDPVQHDRADFRHICFYCGSCGSCCGFGPGDSDLPQPRYCGCGRDRFIERIKRGNI